MLVDTGLGHLSFGLFRGPVSESGVDPSPVIVAFDIGEQVSSCFLPSCPLPLADELDPEGVEEAFHGRIIVAARRPAYRGFSFHCNELLAVRFRGVLAAAVGMTDEAFGRSLPLRSRHQGGQRQLCSHMVAHRPSDDLAGRQIEHSREIKPSLAGRDIDNVGQPDAVGCFRDELLFQQVGRNRKIVAAVGRTRLEPAARKSADTMSPHQTFDTATTCRRAFRAQRGMHPGLP